MALEQHAIPSQVTSYEFRLVGDMTLKQFGWLASGIILALIIYSFPLPGYIRWPLILFFAPAGALIAFVPIEGRGIDRWILAFTKAIYSPTEFLWRQEHPVPEIFKKSSQRLNASTAKITIQDQTKLEEYIESLPRIHILNQLDQQESQQIQEINQLMATAYTSDPSFQSAPSESPPKSKMIADQSTVPGLSDLPKYQSPQSLQIDLDELEKQVAQTLTDQPQAQISSSQDQLPETPAPSSPATFASDTKASSSLPLQPTVEFTPVTVQSTDISPGQPVNPPAGVSPTYSDQSLVPTPTQPNVIAGMITDQQGKIVDSAIVEITDFNNKPVRALKTNKLGQFTIATSLKNGQYIIVIEKPGLIFDPISIKAEGKIIPPISIQSK